MWSNQNRARYDRSRLRYPSDLTDAEWAHVEPLIPPAKRGGNRRHVDEREVVNGLMYVLSTGCQWRAVPKDLPPRSTLYDYFDGWSWDGTLDRIHDALYVKCREAVAREASPTAAIIDSQSALPTAMGAIPRKRARPTRPATVSAASPTCRRANRSRSSSIASRSTKIAPAPKSWSAGSPRRKAARRNSCSTSRRWGGSAPLA